MGLAGVTVHPVRIETLSLAVDAVTARALAPLVQQSPGAAEPVAEIYGAFSRQFNLGKSSEDAIENLVEMAKQAGKPVSAMAAHSGS